MKYKILVILKQLCLFFPLFERTREIKVCQRCNFIGSLNIPEKRECEFVQLVASSARYNFISYNFLNRTNAGLLRLFVHTLITIEFHLSNFVIRRS